MSDSSISSPANRLFSFADDLKEFMISGCDINYSLLATNLLNYNFDSVENINFNFSTLIQTFDDINEGRTSRNSFSVPRVLAFRKFFNESQNIRLVGYI